MYSEGQFPNKTNTLGFSSGSQSYPPTVHKHGNSIWQAVKDEAEVSTPGVCTYVLSMYIHYAIFQAMLYMLVLWSGEQLAKSIAVPIRRAAILLAQLLEEGHAPNLFYLLNLYIVPLICEVFFPFIIRDFSYIRRC